MNSGRFQPGHRRNVVHGQAGKSNRSPEYRAWNNMLCRGRFVHPSFKEFTVFFAEVGPRPSSKHSIDRINNNRGYEPGNLRWATMHQQQRNKSTNRLISIEGETKCLMDWSIQSEVHYLTIRTRLEHGWPPQEAVFTKPRPHWRNNDGTKTKD